MSDIAQVAGLDGTRAGWVAVTWSGPGTPASARPVADLGDFITREAPAGAARVEDMIIGYIDGEA